MSKFYTIIKKEENKYNFVEKINDKEYNKKGEITRTSYGLCGGNNLHGIKFPNITSCYHFFSHDDKQDGENTIVKEETIKNSNMALPPYVRKGDIIMDTSKVEDFSYFLKGNSDKLREFTPDIDYSSAEKLVRAFMGLESLEILHTINSKKCKYFGEAFRDCKKIQTVDVDTSSGINFYEMFLGCDNLTNIELDMSNANQLQRMFSCCKKLKKVEFKNFCKDTDFKPNYTGLFEVCSSLPDIDLKNVKSSSYDDLFDGCTSLKTIKNLDMGGRILEYPAGITSYGTTVFRKCYILEDLDVHNIYCRLYLNDSPNLSEESLLQIAKELITPYEIRDNVPEWEIALYLNDNDRIKNYLNNTYCRVIENDNKKVPIELVNSDESNAISLYDYITNVKKWKVKYEASS